MTELSTEPLVLKLTPVTLPEMTFRSAGEFPPTIVREPTLIDTPFALPRIVLPSLPKPMMLPWTRLSLAPTPLIWMPWLVLPLMTFPEPPTPIWLAEAPAWIDTP